MILLFVGAGGSAAVDSEKFPTTVEFFSRLPENVSKSKWHDFIVKFLTMKIGEGNNPVATIDIEQVLWEIDEGLSHLSAMTNTDRITGWMWGSGETEKLLGRNYNSLIGDVSKQVEQLNQLRYSIFEKVHDFYGEKLSEENHATNPWVSFINDLFQLNIGPLEIFTTNYDLIFESTISRNEWNIITGRRQDETGNMVLDRSCWKRNGLSSNQGRLTKLHGSVDWKRVGREILCYRGSDDSFNPNNNAVLYPGYKGRPHDSPFDQFYNHLEHVASNARCCDLCRILI